MKCCSQMCKWNTYAEGCTKPFDEVCPLSNMSVARGANVITNAQRIRSMTDEELAELLARETYRIAKPCFDALGYVLEEQVIYARRLNWLKQPYEEEP